jgi:hypothetical protein
MSFSAAWLAVLRPRARVMAKVLRKRDIALKVCI